MVTSVLWSFWILVLLLILWITEILLDILNKRFACRDDVLDWFLSYWAVPGVLCRLCICLRTICFGVPQGSIVGPSQFASYTEDIQEVIPLSYHLYADNTQLLALTTIHSIGECRRDLEHCVVSVQRWCMSTSA